MEAKEKQSATIIVYGIKILGAFFLHDQGFRRYVTQTGLVAWHRPANDPKLYTQGLATLLALGGASYYAYNEVAFLALGKVNPVTHAVGNTIKRVVIIVASVIAFKTPMSTGSMLDK
jgi:hypothetical protein